MDINSLKLKYVSVFGDLVSLQNYENELNNALARTPANLQQSKFSELENVQRNINALKLEVQNVKQTLVARGINSGEISLLETRAKQEGAVKSSRQAQIPQNPGLEQHLLQAIENEKYHDKHIKEVEEWNRQEKERQKLFLEQQQKLLDFQKEIERKRLEDEKALSQQLEEMKKKEEFLQMKEKTLTEQEKIKLSQIENELRFIENEKKLLEAQRIQLDPLKQQKQFELELERANLLGVGPSPNNNNNNNNNNYNNNNMSGFPQAPNQMSFSGNLPNAGGSVQYGSLMYPNAIQGGPGLTPTFLPGQTVNGMGFPNNLSMQLNSPSQINPNNQMNNLSMQMNSPSNIAQANIAKGAPFNPNSPFPNSPVPPVAPNQMNFGQVPQLNPQFQQQFQSMDPNSQASIYASQNPLLQQTDLEKQLWLEQQNALQSQHSFSLQQMQANHAKNLQDQEEALRRQWDAKYATGNLERNAISQHLPDDVLMRMSELELRNWMDQANLSRFYEEFLQRRQKLLEEEMWLKQQDMINKQMALSFKEDDLRSKEMSIQQQKEAEMRAKNRVFSVFVEKTGPDGRKTGEVLKLQVRAGDTVFRICERIGYDKELFKLQLQYNGMTLEDPDRSLMEFGIPDNAVFVTKLVPSISVDIMNLIPCEDCGKAFDAEVFAAHKCMKGYSQELPKDSRRGSSNMRGNSRPSVTTTTTTTTIVKRSCKYCGGLYPSASLDSHIANCPKRPGNRVYYY